VLVIDPARRAVVGRIPTGRPQSHSLALAPDGSRAFTATWVVAQSASWT
jgi:hypothetical protein